MYSCPIRRHRLEDGLISPPACSAGVGRRRLVGSSISHDRIADKAVPPSTKERREMQTLELTDDEVSDLRIALEDLVVKYISDYTDLLQGPHREAAAESIISPYILYKKLGGLDAWFTPREKAVLLEICPKEDNGE